MRGFPGLVRLYLVRLPVTRREVITKLKPAFGKHGSRLYFSGLRQGFVRGGILMSGRHVCYGMGLRDGAALRLDPSRWPSISDSHLKAKFRLSDG
ncbi:hypothetical protein DB345_19855 [Spartobacteria bacterium LR76]|nr:hypothetical protein DB345_19855 [Spartobacteria bacterium LR76]